MTEQHLLSIVATLFGLLTAILSWAGLRVLSKLDHLSEQVVSMRADVVAMMTDADNILHGRITEVDRRLTRVEARCQIEHGHAGKP